MQSYEKKTNPASFLRDLFVIYTMSILFLFFPLSTLTKQELNLTFL